MNKQFIFSVMSITLLASNAYGMDMDNFDEQLLALQGHNVAIKRSSPSLEKMAAPQTPAPRLNPIRGQAHPIVSAIEGESEEVAVSILVKHAMLQSSSIDKIDIIGYPQELELHLLAHKAELVEGLASLDTALSLVETDSGDTRLVVDVSKIFPYPLGATSAELKLRHLFQLHEEEIILVQDGNLLLATTGQKREARNQINRILQAIIQHNDGNVAIDVVKLQQAVIKVTPKVHCQAPSLWKNVLIPAAKGTALIGLGYLLAKYESASSKS